MLGPVTGGCFSSALGQAAIFTLQPFFPNIDLTDHQALLLRGIALVLKYSPGNLKFPKLRLDLCSIPTTGTVSQSRWRSNVRFLML